MRTKEFSCKTLDTDICEAYTNLHVQPLCQKQMDLLVAVDASSITINMGSRTICYVRRGRRGTFSAIPLDKVLIQFWGTLGGGEYSIMSSIVLIMGSARLVKDHTLTKRLVCPLKDCDM